MYSLKELFSLAENACSLRERMRGQFKQDLASASEEENWQKWQAIASHDQEEIFQSRLALWHLNRDEAQSRLRKPLFHSSELPNWVITFQEFLLGLKEKTCPKLPFEKKLPFIDLLYPYLHVAQKKLQRTLPTMTQSISQSFLYMLASDWIEIFTPTLYSEFSIFRSQNFSSLELLLLQNEENPIDCYRHFIFSFNEEKWKAFFREYSVLARLMVQKFNHWIEVAQEFYYRFNQDSREIERAFFSNQPTPLITIQGGLSDSHRGGRSVFLLTFLGGKKLIYKPRDIRIEQLFDRFASFCCQQDSTQLLSFKCPSSLVHKEYSWVEYMEQKPCQTPQEGKDFFQRAGQLLALFYALFGIDVHEENLIAHGSYPVLIDSEMLFHRSIWKYSSVKNAQLELTMRLETSVMFTGLLPSWTCVRKGDYRNLGGLSDCPSIKIIALKSVNTDLMKWEDCEIFSPHSNVPFLDKKPLKLADHLKDFKTGFQNMYTFLMTNKEMILDPQHLFYQFQSLKNRLVLRSTAFYTFLLQKSHNPENLRSGLDNSLVFERLFAFLDERYAKNVHIFDQELEQLEKGDIPFFEKNIASEYDAENPDVFSQSIHRIQSLSREDLTFQLGLIDLSVELGVKQSPPHISKSLLVSSLDFVFNPSQGLKEALLIKDVLLKMAHVGHDGSLSWYSITPASESQYKLSVIDFDLYEGSLGIGLFFSALAYVTEDRSFHKIVQQIIKPALDYLTCVPYAKMGLGIDGFGAFLYTLSTIGFLSKEAYLYQQVKELICNFNPKRVLADCRYDILSGSAGSILGFLSAYDILLDEEALSKAILCGWHLLKNREVASTGYRTWKSCGTCLTGFSHGAAGIAYALMRLYEKTQEKQFLEGALEAIEYERSVFLDSVGNWPDFRSESVGKTMTAWCHGATGIGLSRVGALSIYNDSKMLEEIEIASQTTIDHGYRGDDRVCCGTCGRIEFLLTAGLKLNRPEWVQNSLQLAHYVIQTRDSQKFSQPSFINPSFFQGLSGIGYTLLRCAFPDKLPNVLLLENHFST